MVSFLIMKMKWKQLHFTR